MTGYPYNLIQSIRAFRRLSNCFALAAVCLLAVSADLRAQWICGPAFGRPAPYSIPMYGPGPSNATAGPPVTLGRPYVQMALPPGASLLQPTTTRYAPHETVTPELNAAVSVLSELDGRLRLVVPELFLNRLLSRSDVDAGPVTDVILGANVSGHQNTETCLTVDVQASPDTARLQLELTGTTTNQTIGTTPQAAVRSRGTHQFRLTKQVDFDGLQFTTRTPAAWVTPQLTNEAAATPLTGVPVLGPIANQIALTEAERRRPLAEQVVTQRVTQQVAPRFNSEVDQQLTNANYRLQGLARRYLSDSDRPPSLRLSSTSDHILFSYDPPHATLRIVPRSVVPNEAEGPLLPAPRKEDASPEEDDGATIIRQISKRTRPALTSTPRVLSLDPSLKEGAAFTVAVHEDVVNAALDRLPLSGLTLSDRAIDRLLGVLDDVLAGDSVNMFSLDGLAAIEPEFAHLILAEHSPVRVQFRNGEVRFVADSGFRPLLTPEVPTQRITIPFSLSEQNGRLILVPGEAAVESPPGVEESAMVDLARPVIRQQVGNRLRTIAIPREFPLTLPGRPGTALVLREISVSDGWLVVCVD